MSLTPQTPDDDLNVDTLAASLRADSQDNATLLEVLAVKLAETLPAATQVRRSGWRGKGPVESIVVDLGDRRLAVSSDRGRVATRVDSVAAGIVVKHTECSIDEWLGELASRLAALAERDAATRVALSRLLID